MLKKSCFFCCAAMVFVNHSMLGMATATTDEAERARKNQERRLIAYQERSLIAYHDKTVAELCYRTEGFVLHRTKKCTNLLAYRAASGQFHGEEFPPSIERILLNGLRAAVVEGLLQHMAEKNAAAEIQAGDVLPAQELVDSMVAEQNIMPETTQRAQGYDGLTSCFFAPHSGYGIYISYRDFF